MERETVAQGAVAGGGARLDSEERGRAAPRRRRGPVSWVVLGVLVAGLVALTVPVARDMPVDGDLRLRSAFDLGRGTPNPGVRKSGRLSQNANGFTVKGRARGRVVVPVRFPRRLRDERALLGI